MGIQRVVSVSSVSAGVDAKVMEDPIFSTSLSSPLPARPPHTPPYPTVSPLVWAWIAAATMWVRVVVERADFGVGFGFTIDDVCVSWSAMSRGMVLPMRAWNA